MKNVNYPADSEFNKLSKPTTKIMHFLKIVNYVDKHEYSRDCFEAHAKLNWLNPLTYLFILIFYTITLVVNLVILPVKNFTEVMDAVLNIRVLAYTDKQNNESKE